MKQLVVAAAICVAFAAHATVLVPLDTKALTERAERVVLGTVESQVARWTDDHQAIYTDVTIRVARVYKGAVKPGERVVVRREGGALDGVGMRVFGAANFTVGEEVVVFVETRGSAAYTVGMTQGKLRVTVGSDGAKQVAAALGDVAFTRPNAAAQSLGQPRRLDDFEREIRSYVKGAQ
ncbi:MAG TPA: hypothetical protein VHB97_19865 [Polyangia bacterium]|jgi:hypothetical protein|nr:hypothetical protein [Polyangia bacterium]